MVALSADSENRRANIGERNRPAAGVVAALG
jgi:hypothetical protein